MLSLLVGSDNMLEMIKNKFKHLDLKVKNIMKHGFIFSLLFCLFSVLILYTYHRFYTVPIVFTVGTILFRTSLMFFVDFVICGIAFDTIKKQLI